MKKRLLYSLCAASAIAVFFGCGDDASTPFAPSQSNISSSTDFVPGVESSSSVTTQNPDLSSAVVPGSSTSNPMLSSESNPALSSAVNPGLSSSGTVPPNLGQSSAVVPTSSDTPASSASEVPSSSAGPELGPDGFPTLESYGPPPAEYTKNILNNGNNGWNSRYWDACTPHCAWISNGQ